MSESFVKIDLHGLRQDEAMKVIDKALASTGPRHQPSVDDPRLVSVRAKGKEDHAER